MWPFKKATSNPKDDANKKITCRECGCYVDPLYAIAVEYKYNNYSWRAERIGVHWYCVACKPYYDRVVSNVHEPEKFYKTIPATEIEVDCMGTEIVADSSRRGGSK